MNLRDKFIKSLPLQDNKQKFDYSLTYSDRSKLNNDINIFFIENGYVLIKNFINNQSLEILLQYILLQSQNNYFDNDKFAKATKYGDILMESLQLSILPIIEIFVNKELYPTYSYFRIYSTNNDLHPHIDRPSCEYSISLTINYDAEAIWPLFLIKDKMKIDILLDKGDALLYKGCEVMHGREKFEGKIWMQLFMHFVDKNGENADCKYDGRERMGLGYIRSRQQGIN